ncbi:MAG: Nudix family hydrolase [Gammaproteobacteria bacterium]|nr:MAG: Nudix family hydrolase [Gammaproteobacteria bacterium]
MTEPVEVAAAALVDAAGRVLLAQRHPEAHQGGLWEFPGGKCERDEPVECALVRELREELGIEAEAWRPLIRVRHDYGDRCVVLHVYRVTGWRGKPQGREGQPLAWVRPEALSDYPMPAADRPVVTALQLPDTYLITPPEVLDTEGFLKLLEEALERGIRLLQFRVFGLDQATTRSLYERAEQLCERAGAILMANSALGLRRPTGLHLTSRALRSLKRRPVDVRWLAASCHDADDLARAQDLGVDFAVLSPVLPTPSHPDADPLGWERFAAWVDGVSLPVFALGGMEPSLLETAWRHGAQGIAGIRGIG